MKTLKHTLSALFAVVASIVMLPAMADLPSGYRQLDYVDTDGNQWVNTLFKPVCTNAVEIRASLSAVSDTQFLFCSRRWTNSRKPGERAAWESVPAPRGCRRPMGKSASRAKRVPRRPARECGQDLGIEALPGTLSKARENIGALSPPKQLRATTATR